MLLRSVNDPKPLASPVSEGEIVAGKYRVERVLGVGGMGVVVSARHTTLDQIVAIKFLVANELESREVAIGRFLAEARAAARIESDYVCRVFDVGTLPNGVPFMVMEHLEGRDLDEEIQQRGQLDLVEAVDYVLQAADALAAAHALGIVHRDIKPANLFLALRPDGTRRVKVLDFGISRAGSDVSPRLSDVQGASSLGTPAYMSPEQVRAVPDVDARTDIWGLGAILYELITGQMAFVGDDVKSILDHVLSDDPCPMQSLRRDAPSELEAIVMRCLDRERDRRWPSAATFARALSTYGSAGTFSQLASVQRELGSLASISAVRTNGTNSVEPMVANVRASIPTAPDLEEEMKTREGIVQDWTKLRARKRTARMALIALATVSVVIGAGALLARVTRPHGASDTAAAGPGAPLAADSVLPANVLPSASAEVSATRSAASSSANVYPTINPVHSARGLAPRATGGARPTGRPAPKGSVNHLLDTRD
ncbi:MAG: eukaryotic-like serine/threonine-protein kinase [Myxococcales bacterium]|nr:eukaryotic-like serine/threonine-protein kinase [Myxococcales bacterium]